MTDSAPDLIQPGEKRVYLSAPVVRTASILSFSLVLCFFGLWFLLDREIRAMFTWIQIGTLLFFMVFMLAFMLGVASSTMTLTAAGIKVRNALWTKRFDWHEVADLTYAAGDSWPYLQTVPTDEHPEGRSTMVLGIQRVEGELARERVDEVRGLIRAHRVANGLPATVELPLD